MNSKKTVETVKMVKVSLLEHVFENEHNKSRTSIHNRSGSSRVKYS